MIDRIGSVAGEICGHLDDEKISTLSKIRSIFEHPDEIILLSLGWLTREGHITIELDKQGDEIDFKISLKSRIKE